MMNMVVNTIVSIGQARFKQAQKHRRCNFEAPSRSTRLQRPHSAQIERQADELELGLCLFQAAHTELAKPQNVFDPAVGRLRNPFALAVVKLSLFSFELARLVATVCG